MKRKVTGIVAVFGLLLGGAASATPISLQIGGSELEVLGLGGGIYWYDDNAMGSAVSLDEGEDFWFNFGHVDVLIAAAVGVGQLTVELLSPSVDGSVADVGVFAIEAFLNYGGVGVFWGDPVYFEYSYGGLSGGILSIDMDDILAEFEGGFDLTGTITNVRSPVAVPEPGILLLLGSGLLGAAGLGRRRATRT